MTAIGIYAIITGATGTSAQADVQVAMIDPTPQVIVEKTKTETKTQIEAGVSTENFVKEYFKDTPILAEIARCESGFRQFDKNGNVLRGIKNNKDVGVMQINEYYHAATAEKLGYDLHDIEDNMRFAKEYLYDKQGSRPWLASSPCWSKSAALVSTAIPSNES